MLIDVAQLATVCAPVSSFTDWSAPLVKLGASFTAVTLIETVAEALSHWPSLTLNVKLSGPL